MREIKEGLKRVIDRKGRDEEEKEDTCRGIRREEKGREAKGVINKGY